jgi:hypothetical protein
MLLDAYLAEHGLDKPGHSDYPLFVNQHGNKLSRGGIAWIIGKYQTQAGEPALSSAGISPHVLRHSRAMHLYEAGVPLPYIRDILGHVELATTDIYARASTEAKRKALEAAYDIVTDDLPEWNHDPGLLAGSPACEPSASDRGLCAVLERQHRCHQGQQSSAAHNPALFIRRHLVPVDLQPGHDGAR